ncbi:MAG: aminopeptidase P family N-terminal domain-containing protein, partial [Anaerolineales bacterium]
MSVQWVLIADPRHVNYLSGFWVNSVSFSFGERGLLYLERGGDTILLCDNFTLAAAIGRPFVDRSVVEPWYDHKHAVPNRDHVLFKALEQIRDRLRPATGLLETEWLPIGALEATGQASAAGNTDQISLGSLLRRLRRKKEPDEIELLRCAIRAGEAGQQRGRELVRPGISEFALYREIQSAAMEELGFPAVVYGDFRATSP